MARKKLIRFQHNRNNIRIIQPGHPFYDDLRYSCWQDYFNSCKPLVLELGCGKGEYSVGLAQRFKANNYIGIDIKGDRLWSGANLADTLMLNNVVFLRIMIQELANFFDADTVSEIWIPFPDPRPRNKDRHRRLTHSRFLNIYQTILKPDAYLYFKTDDKALFDFTLEELKSFNIQDLKFTYDYYQSELQVQNLPILTKYERVFLNDSRTIKYLRVKF